MVVWQCDWRGCEFRVPGSQFWSMLARNRLPPNRPRRRSRSRSFTLTIDVEFPKSKEIENENDDEDDWGGRYIALTMYRPPAS